MHRRRRSGPSERSSKPPTSSRRLTRRFRLRCVRRCPGASGLRIHWQTLCHRWPRLSLRRRARGMLCVGEPTERAACSRLRELVTAAPLSRPDLVQGPARGPGSRDIPEEPPAGLRASRSRVPALETSRLPGARRCPMVWGQLVARGGAGRRGVWRPQVQSRRCPGALAEPAYCRRAMAERAFRARPERAVSNSLRELDTAALPSRRERPRSPTGRPGSQAVRSTLPSRQKR